LPAEESRRLSRELLGADLPADAEDLKGSKVPSQIEGFFFRFSCSKESLDAFLKESPVLPDKLDPAAKLNDEYDAGQVYQPTLGLENPGRIDAHWQSARGKMMCNMDVGRDPVQTNRVQVCIGIRISPESK
jgi:hypothetical protein